jgi:hypothetical protein
MVKHMPCKSLSNQSCNSHINCWKYTLSRRYYQIQRVILIIKWSIIQENRWPTLHFTLMKIYGPNHSSHHNVYPFQIQMTFWIIKQMMNFKKTEDIHPWQTLTWCTQGPRFELLKHWKSNEQKFKIIYIYMYIFTYVSEPYAWIL